MPILLNSAGQKVLDAAFRNDVIYERRTKEAIRSVVEALQTNSTLRPRDITDYFSLAVNDATMYVLDQSGKPWRGRSGFTGGNQEIVDSRESVKLHMAECIIAAFNGEYVQIEDLGW